MPTFTCPRRSDSENGPILEPWEVRSHIQTKIQLLARGRVQSGQKLAKIVWTGIGKMVDFGIRPLRELSGVLFSLGGLKASSLNRLFIDTPHLSSNFHLAYLTYLALHTYPPPGFDGPSLLPPPTVPISSLILNDLSKYPVPSVEKVVEWSWVERYVLQKNN